MKLFKKLFKSSKVSSDHLIPLLKSQEHKAAGVMFVNNDTHVLAGYQPNKITPRITGIGGMKNKDETLIYTAIRECIEEIFNIDSHYIPDSLLNDIIKNIVPKDCYMNGTYGIVVYSFDDLIDILKIVKKYKIKTEIYDKIPTTINDLLFLRKCQLNAEIKTFSIIGIENYPAINNVLHKEFIWDIKELYNRIQNNQTTVRYTRHINT